MSNENGSLISTLRSLQLKSLKEASVGPKLASILDRSVYNALFPSGSSEGSEDMLEEDEWDESETLLALAGRASDRPLRAWLGVAVDHSMITEFQANAMLKALRDRYGPLTHSRPPKQKRVTSPIVVREPTPPLVAPEKVNIPPELYPDRVDRLPMGIMRVCRQCRRDHQRCDRVAGKYCKRCVEHGWNCAESIPRTPVGVAKRKRVEEDANSSTPQEPTPTPEDVADDSKILDVDPTAIPAEASISEHIVEERDSPLSVSVGGHHKRRSISTASSTKSRRQRSLSTTSNKDEKPTLRELRTLERETQIPGSKRRRQTSAVDVALEKMGLRKTAANVAFLTEAGLISPDLEGTAIMSHIDENAQMDADEGEPMEERHDVDNVERKAIEEDDAESGTSSHEADSFFDSAVGTPATVSDPQGEPSSVNGLQSSMSSKPAVEDAAH